MDVRTRELCHALAELLSYPADPAATAAALRVAVDLASPGTEGADALARFAARAAVADPSLQQELYTSTFDLQPACAPYVGHQLLREEESARRGPLLARLAEIYERHGFRPREELADHVAETLRFLAVASPCAEVDALIEDGLVPALRRMVETFPDGTNPYRDLLVATAETAAALVRGARAEGRAGEPWRQEVAR